MEPGVPSVYNARRGIEHLHAAMDRAQLVIAQVQPELPWTRGDTAIQPAAIDVLVSAGVPPIELPARPVGRIDRAIADHVARLIPDRATVELGLGAIPQAVTNALGHKQGRGFPFGGPRRHRGDDADGNLAALPLRQPQPGDPNRRDVVYP
jgi:hypothetical protein